MKLPWILILAFAISGPARSAESLSFVAEHIVEVPMDFRYLAFPQTPIDSRQSEWRVQAGYGLVSGGLMQNDVPMLGLQYYAPSSNNRGVIFSLFYDQSSFSGSTGLAVARPILPAGGTIPGEFTVDVKSIKGNGAHYGATAAYVMRRPDESRVQLGVALERLDISSYEVKFETQNLAPNFEGSFEYAGDYSAITPYLSYQWAPREQSLNWTAVARIIAALPLPRVGFKERFIAPGVDESSSEGQHIPDAYIGISYTFEHNSSGWRIDAGGALYSLIVEPVGHSDIKSSFSINVSRSW